MLRRLHKEQPESFAFTADNQAWAEAQISKYPEGREASAIIPLLWRAQEQEGWLTRPAIEHVAAMLGLAYIRALEVATFYFMFQLQPVGSVAHVQICGTTSCMLCGAEDLAKLCRDRIGAPHDVSSDGKFSWEEVECLGACTNAPMAQIGKDYYEDLTVERLGEILDDMADGKVPVPGPQNGRYASEPVSGLTSLTSHESGRTQYNASAALATDIGDTIKRIDGTEVPLVAPWQDNGGRSKLLETPDADADIDRMRGAASDGVAEVQGSDAKRAAKPETDAEGPAAEGEKPATLDAARDGGPDDLKKIKGVGPKLEALLHSLGFYHFDQIAAWTDAEIAWVDSNLEGFTGRVTRDEWVAQAKRLSE